MNFSLDDDHKVLKDSAQVFLDAEVSLKPLLTPGATVRDAGYAGNWARIASMGWAGLMIPEEYRGAGLSCVDLVMVVEELGRTLTPSPFLGTLLGGLAVLKGGNDAQKLRLLPPAATGETILALAMAGPGGREDGPDPYTVATRSNDGWRINGVKALVIDAADARVLVVSAQDAQSGSRRFFLVEAGQTGVHIALEPWRDITRQVCTVTLTDAVAEPLGAQDAGLWPWLRDHALVALSAENSAGLRHVLNVTTDYARQRVAFGKPIGAYQAIKHSLADMLGQAECARTATLYAAWTLAEGDARAPLAAAMAKAYSGDAYVAATQRGIQIFGAIGFTWEMENHLYLKRARGNAELLGAAPDHRSRVIDLALAQAA